MDPTRIVSACRSAGDYLILHLEKVLPPSIDLPNSKNLAGARFDQLRGNTNSVFDPLETTANHPSCTQIQSKRGHGSGIIRVDFSLPDYPQHMGAVNNLNGGKLSEVVSDGFGDSRADPVRIQCARDAAEVENCDRRRW